MGVTPFRRPKKKKAKESETVDESQRCPECGWKMPTNVYVDRAAVRLHIPFRVTFHIDCPECGARLLMLVGFE